ncbi:MAG TPA: hypothetical protein PLB41_11935 [Rubrivivax sp.]|jgi:hypothetical protein|nr:hypothetical protein [Pseudomonadota bacterium]HOM14016.1 hypothetical protein [Rubrivivax sp.]
MPTCTRTIVLGLAALAALQSGLAIAGAEDRDGNPIIEERAAVEQANPLGVKPVDADALDGRRGGTDVLNDMLLKGVVAGNRASNLTTGSNVVADGSFSGMVGLPVVVQNTGNGVLIQNATIINVQMK